MQISFSTGQRWFFLALLAAVTFFFLWMIRAYLFPVFWAIVFALLLYPTYKKLERRIKNETVSALLVMLGAFLLVVVPVSLLGAQIGREAFELYRSVTESTVLSIESIPAPVVDAVNALGINMQELQSNAASFAKNASAWIFSEALAVSSATFNVVLKTLIMLYLLFFFLKDGERLGRYVMRRLPLGDKKERALFERFAGTTRAILKGTLLTALAQGLAGGILFWIAGIPNPVLWGAVMAFLAVIPAVGPSLVWLPAGLILLALGAVVPAIIVLVGGAVIVGLLDNLLRPMLVGRDTKMPDALILLSILGGLAVFGIAGIVVGPVVAALVLAVWDMFAEEFEKELTAQG